MEDTKNEKKLFYIVILIFTAIILLIGVTIAYFSLSASEEEDSTRIYTGSLALDFHDGQVINPLLIPRDEPTLTDTKFAYKNSFSVESTGSLDQTITIYLDLEKNEFMEDIVKFAIYNGNNQKINTGTISKNGTTTLYANNYLRSGETQNYTLLLWLQDDNTNQNSEQGKKLIGKLRVDGAQIKYE